MRTFFAVLALYALLACTAASVGNAQEAREEILVTSYEAEWGGPFHVVFFGKLFGKLPSRFTFREVRWTTPQQEEFFFELSDDGKVWARLHSDTNVTHSFIDLPGKPARRLNADVVRFVRGIKRLMADTSVYSFEGEFCFGKTQITATAAKASSGASPEMQFSPLISVATYDTLGNPSINGFVEFRKNPHLLHYPLIFIAIPEDELTVTLREIRSTP